MESYIAPIVKTLLPADNSFVLAVIFSWLHLLQINLRRDYELEI